MIRVLLFCLTTLFPFLLAGCGGAKLKRRLSQPVYHFDNDLAFQPNRIWRLRVRWEPYFLDDAKAMIVKNLQLILHADADRARLEAEIKARGGDVGYLRWLESELFPLGNWDRREEGKIARYDNLIVVSFTLRAQKEVARKGYLTLSPVSFPDPLLRAVNDGCHELNWDVLPIGENIGFEVTLESRHENPRAERWRRIDYDSQNFSWRQWSVGDERSISYRTLVQLKTNVARCPLPPKIHEQFELMRRGQPMGVEW